MGWTMNGTMNGTMPAERPICLVRVTSPYFVAGAVWEHQDNPPGWVCVRCAPILERWMRGRSADYVKAEMHSRGWKIEKVEVADAN